MQFGLFGFLMDQFVLMFITLGIGMVVGKALKLGVSGTLFVGLGIGWGVKKYASIIVANGSATEKMIKIAKKVTSISVVDELFFTLFLIFFIATVGLLAADKIGVVVRKYGVKFIILGFLITGMGAAGTYLSTFVFKNLNPYEVTGVYSGALTSSPGLAAAIETTKEQASIKAESYLESSTQEKEKILKIIDKNLKVEDIESLTGEQKKQYVTNAEAGIGTGHALGYPWGVIIVIVAMQFIPKILKINLNSEYERYNREINEKSSDIKEIESGPFDLAAFGIVCVVGYFVGVIKIYMGETLGWFSLGSTGGVLIVSLILGYIGKVGKLSFRMKKEILSEIRDIGLAMFLGIVGLRYGFAAVDSLTGSGIFLSITSIFVGVIAMLSGLLVGKYALGINWIMLSGAICGGMTSTPGLGAAVAAVGGKDDPAAGYGATYPFALFGMVIFTIILHKLPI